MDSLNNDWTILSSILVGKEESPGLFSLPVSEIYHEPEVDSKPSISKQLELLRSER